MSALGHKQTSRPALDPWTDSRLTVCRVGFYVGLKLLKPFVGYTKHRKRALQPFNISCCDGGVRHLRDILGM